MVVSVFCFRESAGYQPSERRMRRTRMRSVCRAHAARSRPGTGRATSVTSSLSVGCARASIREPPAPTTPVAFQDPQYREAVIDLLGAIAYGEISAFERLAEDAKLAPTLEDKVAIASMASAEFGHVGAAARAARRAGRRPVRGDGAVPRADRQVPRAHRARRLVRGPDQGLRRRRDGRRLLPRDRGLPRRRHPRPDRGLAGGLRPLRVRRRPGARRRSPPTRGSAAGWRCGAAG